MGFLNHGRRIRLCVALFLDQGIDTLLTLWKAFSLHVAVSLTNLFWLTRTLQTQKFVFFFLKHRNFVFIIYLLLLFLFWGTWGILKIFVAVKILSRIRFQKPSKMCFHLKDKSNSTWSFIMKKLLHVMTLVFENWNEVRGS